MACRELLLDMIYDDFSVRSRMSSLLGQDRMQGATGPRTVQGGTQVNPPVSPIYGPDTRISEGYGGGS